MKNILKEILMATGIAVVILAFLDITMPPYELPESIKQDIIDSLTIELESCRAEKAKLVKDFNTCYT